MCFGSAPDAPETSDPVADPELARQRIQIELDQAAIKADNKRRRMEDDLALLAGKVGRNSLFSGSKGGGGYGSYGYKSLFVPNQGAGPSIVASAYAYQPGGHYSFFSIPVVPPPPVSSPPVVVTPPPVVTPPTGGTPAPPIQPGYPGVPTPVESTPGNPYGGYSRYDFIPVPDGLGLGESGAVNIE